MTFHRADQIFGGAVAFQGGVRGAMVGRQPYAYPMCYRDPPDFDTVIYLPANGGSIALPVILAAQMALVSVSVRQKELYVPCSWRWDLYKDAGNAILPRVAACLASDVFTPTFEDTHTSVASATTILDPGTYWIVIQNTHAANDFGLGRYQVSHSFLLPGTQTKTTVAPNGASLDFAAGWLKDPDSTPDIYAVRLNGAVFGQTTAF